MASRLTDIVTYDSSLKEGEILVLYEGRVVGKLETIKYAATRTVIDPDVKISGEFIYKSVPDDYKYDNRR